MPFDLPILLYFYYMSVCFNNSYIFILIAHYSFYYWNTPFENYWNALFEWFPMILFERLNSYNNKKDSKLIILVS